MHAGPNEIRHDQAVPVAQAQTRADGGGDERVVRGEVVVPSPQRRRPERELDTVSEASIDSFPASDPPPWMGMRLGPPR
jgi:hypothetical protein